MRAIMRIIILAMLNFGVLSCNTGTSNNSSNGEFADTSQRSLFSNSNSAIIIKDSSNYDRAFIEGLSGYTEPVLLADNYLIAGQDTTYFPDDLPPDKECVFTGSDENRRFQLIVTRMNLTCLNYNFELSDKENKIVYTKSGKAILGSMFFLASENDEDSRTGDGYGSSEYSDNTGDCRFSVRIGIGRDDDGKQRALVTYSCKDKNNSALDLEDCPTLTN